MHLEHLACALAVTGSDNGRMHVQEPMALEEGVGGIGELVANAGDGADGVGAWPQVRLLAQELHAVLLLRHRVRGAVARPKVQDLGRLDLDFLQRACGTPEAVSGREHCRAALAGRMAGPRIRISVEVLLFPQLSSAGSAAGTAPAAAPAPASSPQVQGWAQSVALPSFHPLV